MFDEITGSLSPETDLRSAERLRTNTRPQVIFQGQTPQHPNFVLSPEEAASLVSDDPASGAVIHPYLNGKDLTESGAPSRYIIDIPETDAMIAKAEFPAAYNHVLQNVLPAREELVEKEASRNRALLEADPDARLLWERRDFMSKWWHLWRRREDMLDAITTLTRYIVLSRHAVWTRPSIYEFVSPNVHPGDALTVFALEDDYSFGILNSAIHRKYFEERCSKMRVDLRYTSRTVFDSFPWPQAPSDEEVARIVDSVRRLQEVRRDRLADGISLKDQYGSLREPGRNKLRTVHDELDDAVMDAYGFSREDDLLAQLLALNHSIADQEREGLAEPRSPGGTGLSAATSGSFRIEVPPLVPVASSNDLQT